MSADHVSVFDRAAETYDNVGVEFFGVFGRQLCEEAALQPGESVLDIGTGRGAVLFPAADAVGERGRVVGLDLAPGMVERTRQDCVNRGLQHCEIVLGDAANPPFDDETFDAVLSSLVIFFLDDPAAVLRRWVSLVAPGGRLGVTTFVDDADDERLTRIVQRYIDPSAVEQSDGVSPFELVRDPRWLDDALASAGLDAIAASTLRHPTVFADADQAVRWMWSHGMRSALERLSTADLASLSADVAADLDANRLSDGRLGFHTTARFTVGSRPGS